MSQETPRTTTARPALVIVGLGALAALCGGCYERVVSVKGVGANSVQVEEPYQESGTLDRWIFGDEPGDKQRARAKE